MKIKKLFFILIVVFIPLMFSFGCFQFSRIGKQVIHSSGTSSSPVNKDATEHSQSDGTLTKTITVDCSDYNVVQTSDNYNLVLVNGFDLLLVDENTPVLPIQEFTVDLPLNAQINNVNVSFTNPVNLGSLNIPAYSPGDPMESGGHYVNCPNNIGVFPTNKYSYRVATFQNYQEVIVSLIPADFNSSTKQVNLYKTNTVTVSYTTAQKGILEKAYVYHNTCRIGENIRADVMIKNITSSSANFTINASLEDDSGNVVAKQSKTQVIDFNATCTIPLSIPSYDKVGTYTLKINVTDDSGNNVGEWKDIVDIIGGH